MALFNLLTRLLPKKNLVNKTQRTFTGYFKYGKDRRLFVNVQKHGPLFVIS